MKFRLLFLKLTIILNVQQKTLSYSLFLGAYWFWVARILELWSIYMELFAVALFLQGDIWASIFSRKCFFSLQLGVGLFSIPQLHMQLFSSSMMESSYLRLSMKCSTGKLKLVRWVYKVSVNVAMYVSNE